jgi:hypothetical protein
MQAKEWIVEAMVRINRGGMLRIEDGREMQVYVWEGSAWLTQDGDGRDVLVGAGGFFRLDRKGVTVVYALADCALTLTSPYAERHAATVQLIQPGGARPRTLYQGAPRAGGRLAQSLRATVEWARKRVLEPAADRTATAG